MINARIATIISTLIMTTIVYAGEAAELTREEKITAAAIKHRLQLDFDGSTFSGPAWDRLVAEGVAAQFFLIGEEHGIAENPVLIAQLFSKLSTHGYSKLAIEISPTMAWLQEESLYYESMKHDGTLPIVGVNTFLPPDGHGEVGEIELMRSSDSEKVQQVRNVELFREAHWEEGAARLSMLQKVARERKNTFDALMEAAKACSLGTMSHSLYDVGGDYRRNM